MPFEPRRLIILDRDGVINEDSDDYIKSLDEFRPYPQALEAIARLSRNGFLLAVATNQSGIARGYFDVATLDAMHNELCRRTQALGGHIGCIAYCPHGPQDGCGCRKPAIGLLSRIRQSLGFDSLSGAWLIGDSLRDLQAASRAGCQPVLVRTGKGRHTEAAGALPHGTLVHEDLGAFAEALLGSTN